MLAPESSDSASKLLPSEADLARLSRTNPKDRRKHRWVSRRRFGWGWRERWRRCTQYVANSWCIEIGSLLASIALFVALIMLLQQLHGESLARWPWRIQPTTIIAVLSISSKACLMLSVASVMAQTKWIHFQQKQSLIDFHFLDAASRGPLGSLLVIYQVRNPLAVSAAVLTVLALGYESFAQQSVTLGQSTFIPNLPVLSSIYPNFFSEWLNDIQLVGTSPGDTSTCFWKAEAPSTAALPCNRAECTTDPYTTLALCASCEDLSQNISTSCNQDEGFCNSTLPNGLALDEKSQLMAFSANSITESTDMTVSEGVLLADFTMLGMGPTQAFTDLLNNRPPLRIANRCQIYLCAQVFIASNINTAGLSLLPIEKPIAHVRNTTAVFEEGAMHYEINVTKPIVLSDGTMWHSSLPPEEGYGIFTASSKAVDDLRGFFSSLLNKIVDEDNNVWNTSIFQQKIDDPFWTGTVTCAYGGTQSFECMESFECAESFNRRLDTFPDVLNIWTRSMSRLLRVGPGSSTLEPSPADVGPWGGSDGTVIFVSWVWLIFPLVLEVFALVLLVLVIILTKRRHMPIWKTSTIATFFHGIDLTEVAEVTGSEQISTMEAHAASQKFQLRATAMGYRLVRCDEKRTVVPTDRSSH